jgi:hypothetical protein
MAMGTSSWSEHSYLPFWMFVFLSCLKKFFISEKNYLVWIRWLVRKGFSQAARVAFSADMFLKIKTVWLLDVISEMLSF